MARAKRTERTEARRRYRAEQAALTADAATDTAETHAATTASKSGKSSPGAVSTGPQRPGFMAAFRGAFRQADVKADLRSLPRLVTHWGFLAAVAAAVAATAVFVLSTNEFAATADLSNPGTAPTVGTVSNISYLVVSLFVAPPPAAGAFLVGFTAPRASWLGGLLYGVVASACYTAILLSPTGRLFIGTSSPEPFILNAWIVAPLGAMLFAAASAWYKRFLNLANPNRGRQAQKPTTRGRGNARPNSRATGRP